MTKKVSRETKLYKPHINLYLDPSSTNTGVAILKEGTLDVVLDSINLSKLQKPLDISQVDYEKIKFGCIKNYLDKLQEIYEIDLVFMEGIFIQPKFLKSSEVLLKLHGFLIGYFIDKKQYYQPPSIIKKMIAGKGNANKEEVKRVLEEHYHYKFKNSDESDAFALLVSDKGFLEFRLQNKEGGLLDD